MGQRRNHNLPREEPPHKPRYGTGRKWEQARPRTEHDQRVAGVLESLFEALGVQRRVREQAALKVWDDVVGAQIASVARPQGIENGVLTVKVKGAAWKNELTYLETGIRTRLNAALASDLVRTIKFL
ncbi:MAG: DUF721 domain-containing protein [Calditrichaeota bacterium]|nr:DUF721 domain-containing protein [Calditrichota bacterium]